MRTFVRTAVGLSGFLPHPAPVAGRGARPAQRSVATPAPGPADSAVPVRPAVLLAGRPRTAVFVRPLHRLRPDEPGAGRLA